MKYAEFLTPEINLLNDLFSKKTVEYKNAMPFINSLKKKGMIIENNNGEAAIIEIKDTFFPYQIQLLASSQPICEKIISFLELDSTNEYIKNVRQTLPSATIVLTEKQVKGKGKWDRKWFMKEGKSLLFSILLKVDLDEIEHVGMLTFAGALAASYACDDIAGVDTKVKWPNDVLLGTRKLCGVLTESFPLGEKAYDIIIGIGININYDKEDLTEDLQKTSTSLKIETGREIKRIDLFMLFLKHFSNLYNAFLSKNYAEIMDKWQKKADLIKSK
ncbi:MAG: biotin--[acetyl-CoA-carboxylase] ligase [Candidatus Aureabacteria bacterium]|nr:biotin--[acetyl-CoA-carboxylase] ligase [Candidatus Auribacterota bacterium]